MQGANADAEPSCQIGDAQVAIGFIQRVDGAFGQRIGYERGAAPAHQIPQRLRRSRFDAGPRRAAELLGEEGIERVQVGRAVAKFRQARADDQATARRGEAQADAVHFAAGLQPDRTALLAGEAEGLVGADFAIGAVEAQRHAQFGQQLAAAVGIDRLDRRIGRGVAQHPQALHVAAQVVGNRVLGVLHPAHRIRLCAFLQEPAHRAD